jgi:hypothetical protein
MNTKGTASTVTIQMDGVDVVMPLETFNKMTLNQIDVMKSQCSK